MKAGLRKIMSKDALGNDQVRLFTESEVVSLGTKVLENSNGTPYRLATVKYVSANGEEKQATAQIWEKNFTKVKVGDEYLTEVRKVVNPKTGQPGIFLTLSALPTAERAEIDDFDFAEVEADASTIGA